MASWLGYRGNYQNLLGLNPYTGNTRGSRRGMALYNPGVSYGTRAFGRNALTLAPQRLAVGAPGLGGLYGNSLGAGGLNSLSYTGLGAGAIGLGGYGLGGLGASGLAGALQLGGIGGLAVGGLIADGCGVDCVTDPITGEHFCSACAGYGVAQDQLLALEGGVCVCPNCCQIEVNGIDPYLLGGGLAGGLAPAGLVRGCGGPVGDPYGRAGLLSAGGLGARGLVGRRVGVARGVLGQSSYI